MRFRRQIRYRCLLIASIVLTALSLCWGTANAQDPTLPRIAWIQPVDSRQGAYRVVVEVHPGMLDAASTAMGAAPIFLGDQPVQHSYNISGNLLYGFVQELPKIGDGVWSYLYQGSPETLEEARSIYVASGRSIVPIDLPTLLSEGEARRKRIIDVRIETRTEPGPPEMTIYVVKLEVENCSPETFNDVGPFGAVSRPTVYVEEEPADSTVFSAEEGLVVAEFSMRPEENGEISLRYPDWRLTAPAPFISP